jgi:hypothetical protein
MFQLHGVAVGIRYREDAGFLYSVVRASHKTRDRRQALSDPYATIVVAGHEIAELGLSRPAV